MLYLGKGAAQGVDDYVANIEPDRWDVYAKFHRKMVDSHRNCGNDLMADVNILIATRLEEMLVEKSRNCLTAHA